MKASKILCKRTDKFLHKAFCKISDSHLIIIIIARQFIRPVTCQRTLQGRLTEKKWERSSRQLNWNYKPGLYDCLKRCVFRRCYYLLVLSWCFCIAYLLLFCITCQQLKNVDIISVLRYWVNFLC